MTNEEMQKAMEFIVETQKRTAITLESLNKTIGVKKAGQTPSDRRWQRTETRLHALLSHARKRQRETSAPLKKRRPLRKTAADKRIEALANLLERQISERRNRKP